MTKTKNNIILGIDPGLANTGYGLVKVNGHNITLIDCGYIKTDKKDNVSRRLCFIYDNIAALIKKFQPNYLAVEDLFFNKNAKSVMQVGQAKGVILLVGEHNSLNINVYTPLQIKIAITGYGRASKEQIQHMVKVLLNLKNIPKPDHAADALAVALCCANSL